MGRFSFRFARFRFLFHFFQRELTLHFTELYINVDMTIRFFGKESQRLNISRLPLYIQIVAQMSIVQILFSWKLTKKQP